MTRVSTYVKKMSSDLAAPDPGGAGVVALLDLQAAAGGHPGRVPPLA